MLQYFGSYFVPTSIRTTCVQRTILCFLQSQNRRNDPVKRKHSSSVCCKKLCVKAKSTEFYVSFPGNMLRYGYTQINCQVLHTRCFSSTYRFPALTAIDWLWDLTGVEHLEFGAGAEGVAFPNVRKNSKANKIDGKAIAQEINDEIKNEVDALKAAGKRPPHLAVLLVGSDPASIVYVNNKARAADYTGISCDILRIPTSVTENELLKEIDFLNSLTNNDGILIQLPLPPHINERTICDAVLPQKDVDGFHVLNVGRFCVDQRAFIPATPSGVLEIMRRLKIETCGKNAVVCGRSKNVGLPLALHLHSDIGGGDATTTICHRNTPPDQLKFFTKAADILITATGVPGLVTADMVKEGVVVIDIGITRIVDERGKPKLVGDVDYEGVSQKASYITPVPGGVGPVTVAMVIKNTLAAYKNEIDFGVTFQNERKHSRK